MPVVNQRLVVSVAEQMMVAFDRDQPKRMYPVSTSRFGTGDKPRSYKTPLGQLQVVEVIGQGLPPGAKLKARLPTGEIVPVDAPGRDPIVTRVLRLQGMERRNAWTLARAIYIHGTPEESKLKTPASYGCVRMASADIISSLPVGEAWGRGWTSCAGSCRHRINCLPKEHRPFEEAGLREEWIEIWAGEAL
jgi:hypothetical protein